MLAHVVGLLYITHAINCTFRRNKQELMERRRDQKVKEKLRELKAEEREKVRRRCVVG